MAKSLFIKRSHSNVKYRVLTYKGVSMRACEWIRELGISKAAFYSRLSRGISEDKIFAKKSH